MNNPRSSPFVQVLNGIVTVLEEYLFLLSRVRGERVVLYLDLGPAQDLLLGADNARVRQYTNPGGAPGSVDVSLGEAAGVPCAATRKRATAPRKR